MNNKLLIINIAKSGDEVSSPGSVGRVKNDYAPFLTFPCPSCRPESSKTIAKVHIVKLKGNKCKIYTAAVHSGGGVAASPRSACKIKDYLARDGAEVDGASLMVYKVCSICQQAKLSFFAIFFSSAKLAKLIDIGKKETIENKLKFMEICLTKSE